MIIPYLFTAVLVTLSPEGHMARQKVSLPFKDFEACKSYVADIPMMEARQPGMIKFQEPRCDPTGLHFVKKHKY